MSSSTLEDLKLTNDEAKRLGEAMKDEKFRKMLIEYAEEISDPENRKRYEAEIAEMENERGMDISFVNPEPGYVIKTSVNGDTKAFINICKSDKIGKPTSQRERSDSAKHGMHWSIPHSFAPARNDVDHKGCPCHVYDVVFHPDTYRMSETNKRFRTLVNDTAIDGIEKQFNVTLDRNNLKFPKLTFKGKPSATVIRKRKDDFEEGAEKGLLDNMPYPYDNMTTEEKTAQKDAEIAKREEQKIKHAEKTTVKNINKTSINNNTSPHKENIYNKPNTPTVPKYTITHRSDIDLQDFREARDAKTSTRPNQLVIDVELPLINNSASVGLDIFEKSLCLESVKPAAYKLDLALPYPVDENSGGAKFDKAKHRLTVTLNVLPAETPKLPEYSDCEESETEDDIKIISNSNEPKTNLIEVISETFTDETIDNTTQEKNDAEKSDDKNDGEIVEKASKNEELKNKDIWNDETSKNTPNVSYIFPFYNHRQDNETVSIILDVKNVTPDSVVKLFPVENCIQLRFVTMGTGCFPMHYSFTAQFPVECPIAAEHTSVDVSENNVVMVVLKARKSRHHWDKFSVGLDPSSLEEVLFVTEKNLAARLAQLENEATENQKMLQDQSTSASSENDLEVTEMSEKQLTIQIKKPKKKRNRKTKNNGDKSTTEDEEDEEIVDDGPPSADIELVCDHSKKLHSILKARSRSFSESSDDVSSVYSRENSSTSHMSESPISESDEIIHDGVKKTVSFNSHIDRTTFKSNTSVNTMHAALKTKRRNARKREDKREEKRLRRNRHNSNESVGSSSGEEGGGRKRNDSGSGEDASGGAKVLDGLICDASGEQNVPKSGGRKRNDSGSDKETSDCHKLPHGVDGSKGCNERKASKRGGRRRNNSSDKEVPGCGKIEELVNDVEDVSSGSKIVVDMDVTSSEPNVPGVVVENGVSNECNVPDVANDGASGDGTIPDVVENSVQCKSDMVVDGGVLKPSVVCKSDDKIENETIGSDNTSNFTEKHVDTTTKAVCDDEINVTEVELTEKLRDSEKKIAQGDKNKSPAQKEIKSVKFNDKTDAKHEKLDSDDEQENSVPKGSNPGNDVANSKKPDTMLSWDDRASSSKPSMFATKCAFEFTNNMIFDLDED